MNFITADLINSRITKNRESITFNEDDRILNLEFDFSIFPDLIEIKFIGTSINNLSIVIGNQSVLFENLNSVNKVSINSSSFESSKVKFLNSEIIGVDFRDSSFDSISIIKSKIKNFKISDVNLFGVEKNLLIDLSEVENIDISKLISTAKFLIRESKIKYDFLINNSVIEELSVYLAQFYCDTEILNCSLSLRLIQSEFLGAFECMKSRIFRIYSNVCKYSEQVYLSCDGLHDDQKVFINEVELISNEFKGGIFIGGFSDNGSLDIYAENRPFYKIQNVQLSFMGNSPSDMVFRALEIQFFSVTGINKSSAIQVSECVFEKSLVFNDFINMGLFSLGDSNFSNQSSIHFFNANMGVFNLFAMDFSISPIINFYNSDLSKLNYYGLIWPSRQNILRADLGNNFFREMGNPDLEYRDFIVNRKEFYLQLKKVAESKSDVVNALKFHRFEMLCQDQLLKIDKKQPFEENIILFLGKTNNYGNSWLKPVLILLVINVFMSLLATMLFCNCADPSHNGVGPLGYFVNVFFEFLNPLHSKQIFGTGELSPIILILDYLHRLIVSFFAFQIIVAFRKYVRK